MEITKKALSIVYYNFNAIHFHLIFLNLFRNLNFWYFEKCNASEIILATHLLFFRVPTLILNLIHKALRNNFLLPTIRLLLKFNIFAFCLTYLKAFKIYIFCISLLLTYSAVFRLIFKTSALHFLSFFLQDALLH